MSELEARYARGQDTRRMFGAGTITSVGSVPDAWDIAPDLERILGEALFGTIWRRDALSPVQREMITLSTLLVLAREPQLRRHLGNALHVGLTPEQIVELIIHDTWYGGAPAGLNALALCKAVFAERGIGFTPPRVHDPTEAPDRLFERGNQLRMQYMGPPSAARPAPPTEAEAVRCNHAVRHSQPVAKGWQQHTACAFAALRGARPGQRAACLAASRTLARLGGGSQ